MRLSVRFSGLAAAMAIGCFGVAGCHGGGPTQPQSAAGKSAESASVRQYPVRGTVVEDEPASGSVALKTEAIPGFMEAMTMSYRLEQPAALTEMHPGDEIAATLNVDETPDGPANMRLSDIDIIAQAKAEYMPPMQYHVPAPGDTLPNFTLLNQSDKKIQLAQFRGKVLLMTFIYTRCPLSDYCPRMSRNFAEIDKDLSADKAVYAKTHLLSVSFDPSYDTPKVLKSYGEAYTGQYSKATFTHWDFAAPLEKEMPAMEKWFDLGVTPGDNGTLQHSLATLVIGKDGKVIGFYPTNDWPVADVLAQVEKAAA